MGDIFFGWEKALKAAIMNNELSHCNVKNKDGINTNNALMPSWHKFWIVYDPGKPLSEISDRKGMTNKGQTKLYWDTPKLSLSMLRLLKYF